jgi:hypothetical protein
MKNLLNDVWIEFKNEFKIIKENMDKRFTSLENNFLSIERHANDILLFQKFTTRLMDFIINAICLIIGVLITIFIFK